MHPARIRVLLVLRLHAQRDLVVDRRQARKCGAQRAFGQRLAPLLRDDFVDRRRPRAIEHALRVRQRMQRHVHRQRRELHRRNFSALRRELLDIAVFGGGGRENIFVDEALLRERAHERQRGIVDRRRGGGLLEQRGTQRAQHALERDVAHRARSQDRQQQRIAPAIARQFGAGEQGIERGPVGPSLGWRAAWPRRAAAGWRQASRRRARMFRTAAASKRARAQSGARLRRACLAPAARRRDCCWPRRGPACAARAAYKRARPRRACSPAGSAARPRIAARPGRPRARGSAYARHGAVCDSSAAVPRVSGRMARAGGPDCEPCDDAVWQGIRFAKRGISATRRRGRVAEGGGLLNRYTLQGVSRVQIPPAPPPRLRPAIFGGRARLRVTPRTKARRRASRG